MQIPPEAFFNKMKQTTISKYVFKGVLLKIIAIIGIVLIIFGLKLFENIYITILGVIIAAIGFLLHTKFIWTFKAKLKK